MKILEEYKHTKQAIDILNAELAEIKPEVIKVLEVADGRIDITGASFSLRSIKNYEFSETVNTMKKTFEKQKKEITAAIKEQEKDEIQSGTATIKSETFVPVMKVLEGGEQK